jgi:acetyl-CoA carboxylase carboxyl transferase subunit beta
MPFFNKKNYSTIKVRKREMPDGLWLKCPGCSEIVFKQELESNHQMCPKCGYHFQMNRRDRIAMLIEPDTFVERDENLISVDTLSFTGTASYPSKLAENKKKTGYNDAITIGTGKMGELDIGLAVMDFAFLGASMGAVVGEKVTRLIEHCTAHNLPVVIVCASGGARMYEGMFSLMQMAKTSGALARHAAAGLAYIPVLTHPTTAGVMASFATLGDVIVAEPEALIGFAGPRVIKETTQQDLPEGFQRSEFLLKHGLLDVVVKRNKLKETLINLLRFMSKKAA